MRPFTLVALLALTSLCACTTTDLAPVLKPVARDLPLAQINHRTELGGSVEIAIWRDGTVLRRYDKNRFVVAHAMPETLQQLKDRIAELHLNDVPPQVAPKALPMTTLFVVGRRQATRPVAFFSSHQALASPHELTDAPADDQDFHLVWRALRENVTIAAHHTINPEFVPDDFNTRHVWTTDGNGDSIAVLKIYGNKIDNSPTFISVDPTDVFSND